MLEGRVALITGSTDGIGLATARALAARKASIVLNGFGDADLVARLCTEISEQHGVRAIHLPADLSIGEEAAGLVETALLEFGRLDVLVNNASTFYPTRIGAITEAHWNDLLGTNLKAPLFLSQAAAPALAATRGLIINIADIHGQQPLRHHTTYSIAKAGLVMLTRSLARELAPEVRVNAIAPGPVMWPVGGADEALQTEIIGRTALKRLGSPRDVALAARYFAVDAPFVTGQILAVDGGRSVA